MNSYLVVIIVNGKYVTHVIKADTLEEALGAFIAKDIDYSELYQITTLR